jgi:hypothetical protein
MLPGSGSAYRKKYVLSRRFHVKLLAESERYEYTLPGSGSFYVNIRQVLYSVKIGSADLKKKVSAKIRIFSHGEILAKRGRYEYMLPGSGFAYHKKIVTAAIRMHLPGEIFAKGKRSEVPLLLLQLEGVEPVYVWFYGGLEQSMRVRFFVRDSSMGLIFIFLLWIKRVKLSFIWVCSEGTFGVFLLCGS